MTASARLIVLDTNVVLDLFYFNDPLTPPLRAALTAGTLRAAVTSSTFGEWVRVLAYPSFRLPTEQQDALRAQYLSCGEMLSPPPVSGVPRCRDADDQKFLDLAAGLGVPLVSKDHAVLRLKRRQGGFPMIFTPTEALVWLAGGG